MTDIDLDAMRARASAALDHVAAMCDGSQRWKMTIPADPARDSDLILSASLADVPTLVARLAEVEAEHGDALDRVLTLTTACDNFRTENARLGRKLAEVEAERDAAQAEVARFASLAPFSDGAIAVLKAELAGHCAERNAMRPVVEAAEAYVHATRCEIPSDWESRNADIEAARADVEVAVDAYRAGQKAPAAVPARSCRAEYRRPGPPVPGDRIVRCGLPEGHSGDHDEMIDGEPGNSWPARINADPPGLDQPIYREVRE